MRAYDASAEKVLRRAFLDLPVLHANNQRTIIRNRQPDAPVIQIGSGFAYRSYDLADSRRAITDILIPRDIAGLDHVHSVSATANFVAAGKLTYRAMPGPALHILMRDQSVSMFVSALIAAAYWRLEWFSRNLLRLDGQERVAAFFVNTHRRLRRRRLIDGSTFNLPLTQGQIADHLGLSLEHTNRVLRRMREERLLVFENRVVTIEDASRLSSLIRDPLKRGPCESVAIPR
jgi:CRP-like cAMP-binding protein